MTTIVCESMVGSVEGHLARAKSGFGAPTPELARANLRLGAPTCEFARAKAREAKFHLAGGLPGECRAALNGSLG